MKFTRITVNSTDGWHALHPWFAYPFATIVGMVAGGMTEEEILRSFSDLEREDIREALHYAAEALQERELPMVNVA